MKAILTLELFGEDTRELFKLYGNKFKTARINAGMTQQQLADASGVNVRQIRRVELGTSEAGNMSARNLLAIADALNVDPRSLLDKQ